LLGEKVGLHRAGAIIAGFIGIVVIVQPGTEAFHWASLLCILGAVFAALYSIFTRKLAGVDSAATQTMYAGLISMLMVSPFAFNGWVWPSTTATWVAFLGAGIAGALAHQLMAVAHRFASPSALAPFSYLELLYLAFASWVVFGQPPDLWFYIGAPIIICSGLYIFFHEQKQQKAPILVPVED
jgi:drug/metabolite transporter (DMT)-like permease